MYDMAMKMGAPVIGLIDCAGTSSSGSNRRTERIRRDLLKTGSGFWRNSTDHSSIRQLRWWTGSWQPALSDFTFMAEKRKTYS